MGLKSHNDTDIDIAYWLRWVLVSVQHYPQPADHNPTSGLGAIAMAQLEGGLRIYSLLF